MDKKDEIISAQLELIREMTERNIRRLGDDLRFACDGTSQKSSKTSNAEKRSSATNAQSGEASEKIILEKCASGAGSPKAGHGESAEAEDSESFDEILRELDGYIGLERVKAEVRSLANTARILKLRRESDLATEEISLHMVFSGNPGTGKTMIARLMARIYRSLGLLSKGHLTECDRSSLVAGFVGQTAIKTSKVLESALGGVLFIDEAYSLARDDENDFGGEAVDTILKYMEDHRDDLVVIVAGYTEPMEDFIDSNPGLRSRFNNYIEFDDYTPEELVEIFKLNCRRGEYRLEADAEEPLVEYFKRCAENAARFGNARGVRNTFERVLRAQADRLGVLSAPTREELEMITRADVASVIEKAEDAR